MFITLSLYLLVLFDYYLYCFCFILFLRHFYVIYNHSKLNRFLNFNTFYLRM